MHYRFTTTEQAAKNRIQKPAPVLHYFNAPVELDEDNVNEVSTVVHENTFVTRIM